MVFSVIGSSGTGGKGVRWVGGIECGRFCGGSSGVRVREFEDSVVSREGEVWGRCVDGLGEPDVIIQLDVESSVEWVWERCMRAVKVSEVRPIEWFHWANGRGKEGDVLGMVFEGGGLGGAEFVKAVSAITKQFNNFIVALETVRKFGDAVSVSFALDLDMDHDDVVVGEEVLG